jgi:saccharopine dehydrogenase (NAD+, L-lysine-forming)
VHFWLRHETKPNEARTALLPEHVKTLLAAGHKVTVEHSPVRCAPDNEYEKVGATMVPANSWKTAPKDSVIMGLKELPEEDTPLVHRHIFFAHCFKGQAGAKELLIRFKKGGAELFDLEFLNDASGRRVAAFGRAAGTVGMALGLLNWAYQQLRPGNEKPMEPQLTTYNSYEDLVKQVKSVLDEAKAKTGASPKSIVIGALGRCGSGSCWFAESCGLGGAAHLSRWDLAETKKGGPFQEILDHDIFINDIYLMSHIPPFLTKDLTEQPRKLSVVVDVSCDATNPFNPVPIYSKITDFDEPAVRVARGLDVIAIDHLPSLVPRESSKEFVDSLLPHLLQFPNSPVWSGALKLFNDKVVAVVKD